MRNLEEQSFEMFGAGFARFAGVGNKPMILSHLWEGAWAAGGGYDQSQWISIV